MSTCFACGGSGVIVCLLTKDQRYEYTFGCNHCPAYEARKLKHPPRWHDGLKEEYRPISLRIDSFAAGLKARGAAFNSVAGK